MWKRRSVICLAVAAAVSLICAFTGHTLATTGINQELSFEGKVVTSAGINIPDGNYNVEFKIYAGGTNTGGGTLDWTEDELVSGAGGSSPVTFTSGTFQVNLGATCAFSGGTCQGNTNTAIDWNTYPLYLSIQIGSTTSCTPSGNFHTNCSGDGEMSPYILLTSTPYAFNANEVGGLTASQLVQLSPGSQQSGTINVSGNIQSGGTLQATTLDTPSAGTLTVGGTATAISLIDNTTVTSGNTLTIQGNNAVNLGSTTAAGGILFQDGTANNYKVTLTTPALGASYTLDFPSTAPSTSQCLESGPSTASQLVFTSCGGGGGISSVGTLDGQTPNANGAVISGTSIYLQSASTSNPGLVNIDSQTFAGTKVFQTTTNSATAFQIQNASASPLFNADTLNGVTTNYGNFNVLGGSCNYTTYTAAVGALTPSAYWKLEDTGSTAADSSGNSDTGTLNNMTVNQTPGPFSCSTSKPYMTFNGTSSDITTPNTATQPTTYSQVVMFKTTGSGPMIVSTNGVLQNQSNLYVGSDGLLYAGIYTGSVVQTVHSSAPVNDNVWHEAVATESPTAGLTLYLDGTEVASNSSYNSVSTFAGAKWQLGKSQNNSGWPNDTGTLWYTGSLAEVATFLTVLSSSSVSNLANYAGFGASSVGIGTSSPSATLDVAGTTVFQPSADSTTAFQIQNAAGQADLTFDTTQNNLIINQGGLTIQGIGDFTTNPTLTLNTSGGGLTNGTTYTYFVSGNGGTGVTKAFPTTPTSETPANSVSSITVSWTAITGATGYTIYRSTDGGTTWRANVVGANVTSILDNGTNFTWTTSSFPFQNNNTTGDIVLPENSGITWSGDGSSFQDYGNGTQLQIDGTNAIFEASKGLYFQDSNNSYQEEFAIQNNGQVLFQNAVDSNAAFTIENVATAPLFTADTSDALIQIGSATADTTQVNLALDQSNTFADTGTCGTSASSPNGALYYNTASNAIRACVNGNWEDMATTSGLGILLFGVVPDSSNATTPGDVSGITGNNKSPCEVYWSATQAVTVAPCTAYSGGRKVIIPSTTISTSGIAASHYQNICINSSGVPALFGTSSTADGGTSGAPTLPTFSVNNPILCLATIKTTTTAGNVGNIYDTRTFTNTQKEFDTCTAVTGSVLDVGMVVVGFGTTADEVEIIATATSGPQRGVIVAASSATSTTTINCIVATGGQQYVKTTSTAAVNSALESSTTIGYGTGITPSTTLTAVKVIGGWLQHGVDTSCTAITNCQYSALVELGGSR